MGDFDQVVERKALATGATRNAYPKPDGRTRREAASDFAATRAGGGDLAEPSSRSVRSRPDCSGADRGYDDDQCGSRVREVFREVAQGWTMSSKAEKPPWTGRPFLFPARTWCERTMLRFRPGRRSRAHRSCRRKSTGTSIPSGAGRWPAGRDDGCCDY